jgi:hypothetical protein
MRDRWLAGTRSPFAARADGRRARHTLQLASKASGAGATAPADPAAWSGPCMGCRTPGGRRVRRSAGGLSTAPSRVTGPIVKAGSPCLCGDAPAPDVLLISYASVHPNVRKLHIEDQRVLIPFALPDQSCRRATCLCWRMKCRMSEPRLIEGLALLHWLGACRFGAASQRVGRFMQSLAEGPPGQ